MCVVCSYLLFFMELLWLIDELNKSFGIFSILLVRVLIICWVGWLLIVSVQVIVTSSLIACLKSFLRKNWFDCGFLNLYIHEVRISKIRLYLLVFYFSCYFIIVIIPFRLAAYKKVILFAIWVFKIQKKEER
jgi:hypothetical protein